MDKSEKVILFIQKRARRAGAQVSLSRIVTSEEIRDLNPNPFVLLGDDGWLGSFLSEQSIPHIARPWPSPRSLIGRLGGLDQFSKRFIKHLTAQGLTPGAIIANDHQESLLAQSLAKASGGPPVAVILRTPGMNQNDFEKYQCHRCDRIFARGEDLTARAKQWSGRDVTCMLGSFTDTDFHPPHPKPSTFPTRILIAGSEEPRKGFADFLEALFLIEQSEPNFPALECVFTGAEPTDEQSASILKSPFRSQFHFKGRIDQFIDFAQDFDLAIHPSRSESFGMAPLELILAGIPTMVSTTGIIDQLNISPEWKFQPENPTELAEKLTSLWKNWPNLDPHIQEIQHHIRERYHISQTAQQVANFVKSCT